MKTFLLLLFLTASVTFLHAAGEDSRAPNIVYILADDLGYGDLGCYGQTRYATPHLDRLAAEGMRFTQHYAGSCVCAPSRSVLMTGQHTGHTPVRGNKSHKPEGQWPLPDTSYTVAEMLQQAGYVTGAFGKWGLGYPGSEGDPLRQGFDVFYGYNCQGLAHNYFPAYLWHNDRKVMLKKNRGDRNKQYSPELIQKEVLRFIKKNRKKKFFLYYPMTLPHAELLTREEYMEPFRGKYLPEKSYKGAEYGDPRFRRGAYGTQPEAHAAYVAMVTLLDRQVGEVMAQLRRLGLAENTLVIFSSDNGPHLEGGADPDYFDSNGPLRGYKRDLYEGGIREPMIAWWPGHVPAGSVSDVVSYFGDMLPTFAEVAGSAPPSATDGISLLPALLGREGQQQHDLLYWEFYERHGRRALRKGNWKLVQYNLFVPEKTTTELYDLNTDIGETRNVATQHPEIVQEMLDIMHREHTPNPVWDFPEGVK